MKPTPGVYTLRMPNNDGPGTAMGMRLFDPDGKELSHILGFKVEGLPNELMRLTLEVPVRIEVEHTVSVKLEMPK